jgi:ubiquinone/menaquinone biosynthesis C-methylase UbiE
MKTITTPEQIIETANAFRESRVLLTAVELGIFTALDKHMLTSEEVSQKINTNNRAVNRLMNALCGMGLLRKVKDKFYNSELAAKYLVEGKPDFMGGLFHTNNLWNTWTHLTESVRKGSSYGGEQNKKGNVGHPTPRGEHFANGEDYVEAFIAAMHYRGVKQAEILSMMVDLTDKNKVLDVGGGSGAFSMGFIKRKPSIHSTIIDLPHVIPLTKKYVEQEGLKDNFDFIEGNYLTADFGKNYDLILLSAIVHINSYEQNKMLIKKCADALNQKGMVITSDFVMSEDRTEPYTGALFSINMLVNTAAGDTYTEKEYREWFENAGLKNVEHKPTSFGSDLMIGYKL